MVRPVVQIPAVFTKQMYVCISMYVNDTVFAGQIHIYLLRQIRHRRSDSSLRGRPCAHFHRLQMEPAAASLASIAGLGRRRARYQLWSTNLTGQPCVRNTLTLKGLTFTLCYVYNDFLKCAFTNPVCPYEVFRK